MKLIPKQISLLYSKQDLKANLYIRLRWLCCPFEKIESYLPKSGVIFDVGCGYGLLANYLSLNSSGRKVIGTDLSSRRIGIAQKTVGSRKNVEFLEKDVKDLDLESCDGLVVSDFLHHIPPNVAQDFFQLIYRRLKPEGRLVIQEVGRSPRWKYLTTLLIDKLLNPGKPLYYCSADEWRKRLGNVGFLVEVIPVDKGLFLADVLLICTKK